MEMPPPPLTWRKLQDLQAELMADDIEIAPSMCEWTEAEARAFFESGGQHRPPWRPSLEAMAWLPYWQQRLHSPALRLVCMHPMGSSANFWYPTSGTHNPISSARLNPFLDNHEWLEVLAPELPGRLTRRDEPHMTDMRTLTDALVELLRPMVLDGTPYALAGHSMGSWIAYDLLRNLSERGLPPPAGLFANCFPAPHLPKQTHGVGLSAPPSLSADDTLDQDTIKGCLAWGAPAVAFRPDQLRRWWPTHQADGSILASYEFDGDRTSPPPLPCPVWVTRASEDRGPPPQAVASWAALADGGCADGFELYELSGAHHLFLKEDRARVEWMTWALAKLRPLASRVSSE